ncbi:MAG: hypothetical protein Kow0029_16870 [Candidatus Rifleibacteriota bacterium]
MNLKIPGFLFLAFLFLGHYSVAASEMTVHGNVFIKKDLQKDFIKCSEKLKDLNAPLMLTVPAELKNPVATDSFVLLASTTITIFPGSIIKYDKGIFVPLMGRFIVSAEKETEPLIFRGSRFYCEYHSGEMAIEITPKNHVYIAMSGYGTAWVKDSDRKIFNFQPGTEVHLPPFAHTEVQERLSGLWSQPPECAVVRNIQEVFSPTAVEGFANKSADYESNSETDNNINASETGFLEENPEAEKKIEP